MKLNSKYDRVYRDLLAQVGSSRWAHEMLTCFWPSKGPDFESGPRFLFVGRATNGWGERSDGIWIEHGRVPDVNRVAAYPTSNAKKHGNELSWVEEEQGTGGRKFSALAFWSMIRWFVSPDDDDDVDELWTCGWTTRVAWTNLYKIAPAKGGNPSKKLRDLQLEHCQELLRLEVESLRPDVIFFLTGDSFYRDFAGDGSIPIPTRERSAVGGKFCRRPAVLLPHPVHAYRLRLGNSNAWQEAERALR